MDQAMDIGRASRDIPDEASGIDFGAWARALRARYGALLLATLVCGAVGYAISFLANPRWTSHVTFMPPAQQQSSAASALSSLGTLAGIAGTAGLKSPIEQYISLMQSETATDRIIDRFQLMKVYDYDLREKTRKLLAQRTRIIAGKKDGLLTVEVEDTDPRRAAAMANQYVEELRHLTGTLAVTEAQQRRVFFQNQLQEVRDKLASAQSALQQSGFDQGALRSEPSASGQGYAKLRADLAAAEVRLETMRQSLADSAPEVRQQSATVGALQAQISQLESTLGSDKRSADYISRYREFKYEETLFDSMARQYEIARVDESREGALIQVIDPAHPAEQKSFPRRIYFAAAGAILGALLISIAILRRARKAGDV